MASGDPRILCVDDEPRVLSGLTRLLRNWFDVTTAASGIAGLEAIRDQEPFLVVVSDMRMPKMDGATFLSHVRRVSPDTVRILLTGQAELDAAIAAVNEGEIFRFLQKPCPPDVLRKAIDGAVEQNRLRSAERVLLGQTLRGSIQMLTEVLSLAHPAAFGRASRIKTLVDELAGALEIENRWPIVVAAMLSQLGCITLPTETVEKLYRGDPLDEAETEMTERLLGIPGQLLENIPRMEPVEEILAYREKQFDGGGRPRTGPVGKDLPLGSRILKVAADYEVLESRGGTPATVLRQLREREGWYDPQILQVLARVRKAPEAKSVSLSELRCGMVFFADVNSRDGMLLVARGQEVTPSLLERIRNFSRRRELQEPLEVIVPPPDPGETASPGLAVRSAAEG